MLNIPQELLIKEIIIVVIAITIQVTLLILLLIFHIIEKKTGKPNPLFKEWP